MKVNIMKLLTVEFPQLLHVSSHAESDVLVSSSFSNAVNLFTAYFSLGQIFSTGGTCCTRRMARWIESDKGALKQELKLIINFVSTRNCEHSLLERREVALLVQGDFDLPTE
jgi:hypothetical protein